MFDFTRVQERFKGFKVIGDVHGEFDAFSALVEEAAEANLFVVGLGDYTDRGPKSPEVMQKVMNLVNDGSMGAIVGNHDDKLWRHLNGNQVAITHGLDLTVEQLGNDSQVGADFHAVMPGFPLWATVMNFTFVHGAFHPVMLKHPFVTQAQKKEFKGISSRALFGQVDGYRNDGVPNRIHDWIDEIPEGHRVFVGHEVVPDQPLMKVGGKGGIAMFIDTGAGKGGVLSSVDVLF